MASPLRSIGQVLKSLQDEFPDISISKIRFLEAEGLISPERAPSGYRRYSGSDIERLAYVLRAQKNHYLPLKVIREHLALIDQGAEPPVLETPAPATLAPTAVAAPMTEADSTAARRSIRRLWPGWCPRIRPSTTPISSSTIFGFQQTIACCLVARSATAVSRHPNSKTPCMSA